MIRIIQTPRAATRITALLAAALVCLMAVFGVSSASAHDELVAASPSNGEVLTSSPKQIALTFSGELKKIGTIIELRNAAGKSVETNYSIAQRDLTIVPAAPLANGNYTLVSRVVSSDGHPIDKKLEFSVKDPAAVAPSPEPSQVHAADTPAPSAAQAPADAPDEAPVAGVPAALIWIAAGIAGIGMIVVVLLKVRRQGK